LGYKGVVKIGAEETYDRRNCWFTRTVTVDGDCIGFTDGVYSCLGCETMKILIAVISHRAGRKQRELIRATLSKVVGMDVRFFVGNGAEDADDCVGLDCDDSYEGLPSKIKAIAGYAVEHDYDCLVKCDDDVILDPDALLKTGFWEYDFTGTIDPEVGPECPFGFLYTLSWDAFCILAQAPLTDCTEENMWVTEALRARHIDVTPLQYGSLVFEDKRQVFGTAAVCIHGRPEWKPGAFLLIAARGCPPVQQ
jgi:hypothetical protein